MHNLSNYNKVILLTHHSEEHILVLYNSHACGNPPQQWRFFCPCRFRAGLIHWGCLQSRLLTMALCQGQRKSRLRWCPGQGMQPLEEDAPLVRATVVKIHRQLGGFSPFSSPISQYLCSSHLLASHPNVDLSVCTSTPAPSTHTHTHACMHIHTVAPLFPVSWRWPFHLLPQGLEMSLQEVLVRRGSSQQSPVALTNLI